MEAAQNARNTSVHQVLNAESCCIQLPRQPSPKKEAANGRPACDMHTLWLTRLPGSLHSHGVANEPRFLAGHRLNSVQQGIPVNAAGLHTSIGQDDLQGQKGYWDDAVDCTALLLTAANCSPQRSCPSLSHGRSVPPLPARLPAQCRVRHVRGCCQRLPPYTVHHQQLIQLTLRLYWLYAVVRKDQYCS